jgi:hypothetical protein
LEYTWRGTLPALTAMLIIPYRDQRPDHVLTLQATAPDCFKVTVKHGDREDRLNLDFRGAGTAGFTRLQADRTVSTVELTAGK